MSGDEERKDTREDDGLPALDAGEAEERRDFLQVGGDGDGSGNDVEQDVPLRAEEHERDGADTHAAADTDQRQQKNREERGSGDRSGDLGEGLGERAQAWMKADRNPDGDRPGSGEQE